MTNNELITVVKRLQRDFERNILWYMEIRDSLTTREVIDLASDADCVGRLYERALRLAQDRGISLENFFDYKEDQS